MRTTYLRPAAHSVLLLAAALFLIWTSTNQAAGQVRDTAVVETPVDTIAAQGEQEQPAVPAETGDNYWPWLLLIAAFVALVIGYALGTVKARRWWQPVPKCLTNCNCKGPAVCTHGAGCNCGAPGCGAGGGHVHCGNRACAAGCAAQCQLAAGHAPPHQCSHGHAF